MTSRVGFDFCFLVDEDDWLAVALLVSSDSVETTAISAQGGLGVVLEAVFFSFLS